MVRRSGRDGKMVLPLLRQGVKMLSFAHVNPSAGVPGAVS